MKKHLLAALLALPGLAQAQTPFACTVKGQLGRTITTPAKIYLSSGFTVIDSAAVKNGTFELKGKGEIPVVGDLILRRNGRLGRLDGPMGDRTRIYIEPGTITVTSPDSLAHATAKGGPNTNDYVRLGIALEPVHARMQALGNEARKLTEAQRQAPEFQARQQALNKEIIQANYAFIKANPNSYASLDALLGMRMWDTPQYATVGPLFEAMSPALKATPQGRDYGTMVQGLKDIGIGQPAPAISQQTPEGKTVTLADYRGKYVLVDFWASWCKPCRAENPAMTKVYNEYKGRNFDILGVSLDFEKNRDKWVKAIADDQLPWTQVSELKGFDVAAAQRYAVRGIPQNFLIGPDGKIVAVNLHGEDLKTTLAKLIK